MYAPVNRTPSPTPTGRNSPVLRNHNRSYGADAYSVDFVKKQSLAVNTEVKDPCVACQHTVAECDARCCLSTQSGTVWLGQRDGSITIHKKDGTLVHIIERRKGAFVWCLAEVGKTVWAGCSDGFIRVLSQMAYHMEAQFSRHGGGGGGVYALAYHAPSNIVFSGSNDFTILAWEASTRSFIQQLTGHSAAIRCLLVDPMGLTLYSGSDDGNIFVWELQTLHKKSEWRGHNKGVHSLARTKDHIWSGSEDATIHIWDPRTGECVGWAEVHTGTVTSLTPVGDKVFSGAGDTVCVWDADKLSLLGTYVVHNGYLSSICVTGVNTIYRLWTAASDSTVRTWTAECQLVDESIQLRERLESLGMVQHENNSLKESHAQLAELTNSLREQIANRDRDLMEQQTGFSVQMTELAAKLRLAEGDEIGRRAMQEENQTLRTNFLEATQKLESFSHHTVAEKEAIGKLTGVLEIENQRLTQETQEKDNTIAALSNKIAALETQLALSLQKQTGLPPSTTTSQANTAALEAQVKALGDLLTKQDNDMKALKVDNAALHNYINQMATQNQTGGGGINKHPPAGDIEHLHREMERLALTTRDSQQRVGDLEAALKTAHEEKYKLHSDLVMLKAELESRHTESDRMHMEGASMANKLRDMDQMFRSRLSLLTDVFKLFKRAEGIDKSYRSGGNVRADLTSLIQQYKTTIGFHYTDDELIHLGSSRHFFDMGQQGCQ